MGVIVPNVMEKGFVGALASELVNVSFTTVFGMRKEYDLKRVVYSVYYNRHRSQRQEGRAEGKGKSPAKRERFHER